MSDDLTGAIAEALGCDVTMDDEGDYYCSEHGDYLHHSGQCLESERIAAALAPAIEARVREARAEELEDAARSIQINNWVDIFRGPLIERAGDLQRLVDWLRERAEKHREEA